jgi:lipoyl(octanoyl) transferase
MKELLVVNLGVVGYGAAWELQRRVVAARKAGNIPDVLLLCEHPNVITLGRSGKMDHLRAPDEMLHQMGVSFFETNRGGDITYHGPGQLVGYPILNLGEIRRDVGWYLRDGRVWNCFAACARAHGSVGGCGFRCARGSEGNTGSSGN